MKIAYPRKSLFETLSLAKFFVREGPLRSGLLEEVEEEVKENEEKKEENK